MSNYFTHLKARDNAGMQDQQTQDISKIDCQGLVAGAFANLTHRWS